MDLTLWRQQRQTSLTLSCGLTVTVRKVTLLDVAAVSGAVPVPLHGAVQALIDQQTQPLRVENLPDQAAVIDLVVKAAVVNPPITDEPTSTSIALNEIPLLDRIEIYSWAQQEVAPLLPFPSPA